MTRILVMNNSGSRCLRMAASRRITAKDNSSQFSLVSFYKKGVANRAGNAKIGTISYGFVLGALMIAGGAFYLYQVNDIATKGYEIKNWENKIQDLNKAGKKMEIHEVELKSMQNIEKATQDLNLVNSSSVSYVELNGPVAMK